MKKEQVWVKASELIEKIAVKRKESVVKEEDEPETKKARKKFDEDGDEWLVLMKQELLDRNVAARQGRN